MHDIAHVDLALFMLVCHHAGARGHDQHLVAGMRAAKADGERLRKPR
jgi:hypothetical protein